MSARNAAITPRNNSTAPLRAVAAIARASHSSCRHGKATTVKVSPVVWGLQELRPLVYPLAQVLLGAVRLVPTPRYFPLRLRCIRALLGLGRAVGQFIPLSPLLLEMLQVLYYPSSSLPHLLTTPLAVDTVARRIPPAPSPKIA